MAKGSGLLNAWAQIPATSFLQSPLVKAVMGQTRLGGGKCLMFRSFNAQTVTRKRRHTEQNWSILQLVASTNASWQIHLGDNPDLGDLGCEIGLCKILESGSESERLLIIHSFPLCDSTYVFNNPFLGMKISPALKHLKKLQSSGLILLWPRPPSRPPVRAPYLSKMCWLFLA